MPRPFSERLTNLMKKQHISSKELALKSGVSATWLSYLLNGKRVPSDDIADKLAESLNVSTDTLMGRSASVIIEDRIEELGWTLEDVARKAGVPFKWLQNLDKIIPGEADDEYDDGPGFELEWDSIIGGEYKSYRWITKVAKVLGLPGSHLRAAPANKKLVNLPKIPKPQIKHMTVDDAAAFLEAIQDDYMYQAIITDLMIGLRRGELLGLKWKDIDFKKGTVLIRRQLIRLTSGETKLQERLKTDAGYRELELPTALITLLKDHKKQQLETRQELIGKEESPAAKVVELAKKKDPQAEDLVFCWPDGRWYTPDHFYRHLQRLLKKHGFEKLSPHGLRHTYATSSVALGVDVSVLSKNMGHTDIATTTIYLHSDREREKAAAAKIEQALLKPKGTITNTITNKAKNLGKKSKKTGS